MASTGGVFTQPPPRADIRLAVFEGRDAQGASAGSEPPTIAPGPHLRRYYGRATSRTVSVAGDSTALPAREGAQPIFFRAASAAKPSGDWLRRVFGVPRLGDVRGLVFIAICALAIAAGILLVLAVRRAPLTGLAERTILSDEVDAPEVEEIKPIQHLPFAGRERPNAPSDLDPLALF
jgi:hypothetical protein